MNLRYNAGDDVLVITLKEGPLSYGEEISANVIAHYSEEDELVEIEILEASSFLTQESRIAVPERAKG
jgi:uncharacterized protein YuzE